MTDPISVREWKLKALTDIWTGDADREGKRLITTGLLGSIRWWFEVLVRGLGGSACDPSDPTNRCPQDSQKKSTDDGHHCVVCELFGCTGWARRFRFQVLDENGNVKRDRIRENETIKLVFTELRPIRPEEWALLDLTLRLIADYGAIGGRTVFKSSDEPNRQDAFHHKDFGLIQIESVIPRVHACTEDELRQYVNHVRWRHVNHGDFAWASLDNFWCVKGRYLAREGEKQSSFNTVLGRKTDKSVKEKKGKRLVRWSDLFEDQNDEIAKWLAGNKQESKKVFSFKNPEGARRTFGFVKPGLTDFDAMKNRLRAVWTDLQGNEFLKGEDIIKKLLSAGIKEESP